MHVAGSQNTGADFLSRLELTPKEKVQLRIRDDILTSPIEVYLQLSDVADEEQLFFLPDEHEESEQEIIARKQLSKSRAQEEKEQQNVNTKVTEMTKVPLNSAVYTFGAIKENARIRSDQDVDLLLNLLRHEERIIMKDGVLMRKYYLEDGTITHHQVLLPKHLIPELLSTLHGKINKHPGITKMIQECRTKNYYPGLATTKRKSAPG